MPASVYLYLWLRCVYIEACISLVIPIKDAGWHHTSLVIDLGDSQVVIELMNWMTRQSDWQQHAVYSKASACYVSSIINPEEVVTLFLQEHPQILRF